MRRFVIQRWDYAAGEYEEPVVGEGSGQGRGGGGIR
jgi:hypothetical protein